MKKWSALQETAPVYDGEPGPPHRIMIDITANPVTGDDEDDFLASGSGSGTSGGGGGGGGGSGDWAVTQKLFTGDAITLHHSTPILPFSSPPHIGNGDATEQQGEASRIDRMPIWLMATIAVSILAVLLLVTFLIVCLVRRKRKAALAQRSARWDRASGAHIATTHKSDERARPSAQQPASLSGYYLGAPTTPAPTTPPPPPPEGEGISGTVNPPPTYSGPLSPVPLLHYDSLHQDGYDLPGNHGYLATGGASEYEEIKL